MIGSAKAPTVKSPPCLTRRWRRILRLILVDAIYFKGSWETPFDKKLTSDKPFAVRGGQTAPHPRMSRKGSMRYLESAGFQAVAIPYASRQASLYVFLPKENLDQFIPDLTPENWEKWMAQFRLREGTLELPRFQAGQQI